MLKLLFNFANLKILITSFALNLNALHLEFEIRNKELVKLYETGKSNKFKVATPIIEKFLYRILQIESAFQIKDLEGSKFLNFRKISTKEFIYSLDVIDGYQLTFEIEWLDKTKGKFFIIDLIHD